MNNYKKPWMITPMTAQGRLEAFAPAGCPDMRHAHAVRRGDRHLDHAAAIRQPRDLGCHSPGGEASQAVQIILDIARRADLPRHSPHDGPVTIAKSKTMVSEEIHLNRALEGAGLRVVETDLGEYIVQLRGEPPSHIITPAVHLNRQQVASLP
jgi:L-lactate dehydrogenase complex protein LldF